MGIYKDTVGLTIDIECGEDISTSTNHILHVKKPDGKWYEWTTGITVQDSTKLRYIQYLLWEDGTVLETQMNS
jgi:hypothetical protein